MESGFLSQHRNCVCSAFDLHSYQPWEISSVVIKVSVRSAHVRIRPDTVLGSCSFNARFNLWFVFFCMCFLFYLSYLLWVPPALPAAVKYASLKTSPHVCWTCWAQVSSLSAVAAPHPPGTRIIYDRKFLMQCRTSPLTRTPPKLPDIPGVTRPVEPNDANRPKHTPDSAADQSLPAEESTGKRGCV